MEKIAFINGSTFIYWSSIILTLAALATICVYASLYLKKGGEPMPLMASIALSAILGMLLARFMHWYCYANAYSGFWSAMTNYTSGGYGLMGVFGGCLLSVLILRLLRVVDDAPMMLDCMTIAGGLGIAIGRLSALFNAADRGVIVKDSVGFPFAAPIMNSVSGLPENRLATFMIQSMLTGLIVLSLVVYCFVSTKRCKKVPHGDVCLLFLLTYGASQIICDSTRYDSMFFRSNGFVSIVQILGLVGIVVPLVIFSIRLVKHTKFRIWYVAIWTGILAMMGLAGYMEYYVQRHGSEAAFAYSWMSVGLVAIIILTLLIRYLAVKAAPEHKKETLNCENEC